jgi:hypothetical protein
VFCAAAVAAASIAINAAETDMRIHDFTGRVTQAAQTAVKRLRTKRSAGEAIQPGGPAEHRIVDASSAERVRSAAPRLANFSLDRKQRIDMWRRRVLLKKGALLRAANLRRGDHCSLAMLDARGIVVAWYEDSRNAPLKEQHVVDRHVSQFYVPADLASNLPGLNLLAAAMSGGNTHEGWRREPSGAVIWGTTVIEAIVLKDGRLQGFTHMTRPAEGPRADRQETMPESRERAESSRQSAEAKWGMSSEDLGSARSG